MIFPSENYPCSACNADNTKFLLRKLDLNVVKCNNCGFVYVNPRVITDKLVSIYQHNYFNNKELGYVSYEQEKRLRVKNFERWLNQAKRFLPASENIRALDIGCAAGYCLDVMKSKGYIAEGIELDEKMCDDLKAAGYEVSRSTLDNFSTTAKYSLITMFDVIEHIPDLDSAFSHLHSLLDNAGILVMVTPNYNSFQRVLFGKRWFQYKPVEHINYFTRRTLSKFAMRNGFEMISHSSSGQYADAKFVINRLNYYDFPILTNIVKKFFSIIKLKNKFFYIDTGSLLVIFKKKRS